MSTNAPAITITTPFTLDESLFNGFNYTIDQIDYLRYGIGKHVDPVGYDKQNRFTAYNNDLKTNHPDVNIKVISINNIFTKPNIVKEFIAFQVTINRYTITPKETLTAEQEWQFAMNLNKQLRSIDGHDLIAFFTETPIVKPNYNQMWINLNDTTISLPDIMIHVDRYLSDDDELRILKYIDSISSFYRNCYNETVKTLIDN